MPQYGPAAVVSSNGIAVDGQGFVTVPGDANVVPFKVTKDPVVAGVYYISVKDPSAKVILTSEPSA